MDTYAKSLENPVVSYGAHGAKTTVRPGTHSAKTPVRLCAACHPGQEYAKSRANDTVIVGQNSSSPRCAC